MQVILGTVSEPLKSVRGCFRVKIVLDVVHVELLIKNEAVEVSIGPIFIRGHECEEFGHDFLVRPLDRYVVREDKFEVVGHILI